MPSKSTNRSGFYFESTKFGTGDDAIVDSLFRLLRKAIESKLRTEFDLEISYNLMIPGFVEIKFPTHQELHLDSKDIGIE